MSCWQLVLFLLLARVVRALADCEGRTVYHNVELVATTMN
jgi:hypothetical protein